VDKNPLATEMAKLSLWLLTLAKYKPFTFLDHAIRCGDSLVGIRDIRQVQYFQLDLDHADRSLFAGPVMGLVDGAMTLRKKIEALPANTVEDVRQKERLLAEAEGNTARLRLAADLLISVEFQPVSSAGEKEALHNSMAIQAGEYVQNGTLEDFTAAAKKVMRGRRALHWPLEFPEVFIERGGFDGIVGNPPFMGGLRLETELGREYRSHLVEYLARGVKGIRGTADLCAYFFLRGAALTRSGGFMGFLATNTISQGDTHEVGLSQLVSDGNSITQAVKSMAWPGDATLEIAKIWLMRGQWRGDCTLDGKRVEGINTRLAEQSGTMGSGLPERLNHNLGKCFIGSYVLGMGFTMRPEQAMRLISDDPRNADVLFPYINGDDLNSSPSQTANRWVINFFDWPLEKAEKYPECLQIVRERVKPERDRLIGRNEMSTRRGTSWWRYAGEAKHLYEAISDLGRVLVRSRVSNINSIAFLPVRMVYSDQIVVFAFEDYHHFAVLQSAFHTVWLEAYSSTLRTDVRCTPGNAYDTFALCHTSKHTAKIACTYYEHSQKSMMERNEGLTRTYRRFHTDSESSSDIQKLRELHVEMDNAVATAYGWSDLGLGHGFHETKQGIRFRISESARREVLSRLLKLNHERYAEEVAQGLHEKRKGGKGRGKMKAANEADFPSLFS
jgi:hypothetical protein